MNSLLIIKDKVKCDFIDLLYKYIINFWLNWDMREELASFIFEYCVEYPR